MNADAINANAMIDRYLQAERDSDTESQIHLRQQWRAYNGDDDLGELATGESEAAGCVDVTF